MTNSTLADKRWDLFFAPVIGHDQAGVQRMRQVRHAADHGVK